MCKTLVCVVLLLISFVTSQKFDIELKCIRNCVNNIDPAKEVELAANCTGSCKGLKYEWSCRGNPKNIKQNLLPDDIYHPNSDMTTYVIKENVLLPSDVYRVILVTGVWGETVRKSILLRIPRNSTDDENGQIWDYDNKDFQIVDSDNKDAQIEAQKLTPEEIIERVKEGEKQLDDFNNNLIEFRNTQKKLLIYLENLPTNTEELIDVKVNLMSKVAFRNGIKVTPDVTDHVVNIEKQISAAQLELVKKKSGSQVLATQIKEFSNKMLNLVAKATSNYSKQTLIEHQTEVSSTVETVSVIDTILPTENYQDYNDFDVFYQAKEKSGRKTMTNLLDVLRNIGNANLLAMESKTDQTEIITEEYCLLNIVDQNRNTIKGKYSICESTLRISSSLKEELRSELTTTAIIFSVVKQDIFWWENDYSESKYVFVEISERKTNMLLQKLKNPVIFSAPANYSNSEKKSGVFRMPDNKSYEELTDKDLTVHQLSIDYDLQALLIQFTDMQPDDEFKVVILINRRPSMKDFLNNYVTIPRKTATDEKNIILHHDSASPGSFCYVAILPENKKKSEYKYNINVSQLSCELWDESLKQWNSYECTVDTQTNLKQMYCSCYHLSLYSLKSRNVKSRIIEDLDIEIGISQQFNYVVLMTISFVLFLYFLCMILVLWINRRRLKTKRVLFLLDNKLSDKHEYYIVVYTGTKKYSQTTSNIGIKIYGTQGESTPHLLRGHYEPVLQTASEDWFYLLTEEDLGIVNKIDLWSDCYGCRLNWYCEKIEVYDIKNNKKSVFEVYDWVSVINEKTEYTVSTKEKVTPVLRTPWDYGLHGLKNHLWIKSFQKLNFPTFTYIERVTVMLSIIICNMSMCLCMLNLPTLHFVSMLLGYGHFTIGILEIGIAIASSAISFFIHRILIYFFSNSKNFNFHKIRTNVIMRYSKNIRLVSWVFLIIILVTNLVTLIVFGLWISYDSSYVWIMTSVIAVALCIIIYETVYVMTWAAIRKKYRVLKFSLDVSEIEKVKDILFKKYGNSGTRNFFKLYYQPISDIEKKIKFETESHRVEARNIIGDIFMFSVYIIVLFCIILLNQDSRSHFSATNIKKMLIDNTYCNCTLSLKKIDSQKSLFKYLHQYFLPTVHSTHWYGDYYSNEAGLLKDFNTKMLGIPLLRQVRIKNNTCYITESMKNYVSHCNKEYELRLEETKNFAPKWKYKDELDGSSTNHIDAIWMYQNWIKSKTTSTIGYLSHYPGGGYLAPLGRTLHNSKLILEYIERTDWIDELTRVIFIEASFYNANENLFNILTIIIEKSASGHFIPSYSLRTSRFIFVNNEIRIAISTAFILFIVVMLVFTWKEVVKLQEFGCSKLSRFFKDPWNVIDLMIIFLAFGFILIYFLRTSTVQSLMEDLENAAHNEYVSFNSALYWDDCVTVVGTLLIVISTVRVGKLLRFLRSFRICELTLYLSAKYLIGMGVINFILIFTYGATGHVIFGTSYDFHTTTESFLSLMLLAFGFHSRFDYDLFSYKHGLIGYIYYIGFLIIILILLNIFITIIFICYRTALKYFEANEEEKLVSYNILNFLKEEYEFFWSKSKGRLEEIRLKAGESKAINEIMLTSTVETSVGKPKFNVVRKKISINSKRIRQMHNKVDNYLYHINNPDKIREQHKDNAPAVLLSRYLSNTDLNLKSAKTPQFSDKRTDEQIFYVVPDNKSEVFCAQKRQKDMKLIVEYLLKTHKNESKSQKKKKIDNKTKLISNKMINAHEEMISSMNTTVLQMINSIQEKQDKQFKDTSTNVKFEDLGYELVSDEDD